MQDISYGGARDRRDYPYPFRKKRYRLFVSFVKKPVLKKFFFKLFKRQLQLSYAFRLYLRNVKLKTKPPKG